ncbi:ring canal kelch-like protein [Leptotrombidium deliense]|uniref:Ring canal kelch-like protein n=1 Tax=Leptotrombidium deliense TaxID=299467 RepID=A0A443SM01_9ACAR|nr:ring canal kelch-like protein [Leptotrombidium deliense]
MDTNAIDILPFTKENSYKQVLDDKLKNLIFPEPYFKAHLTEYANNIRPANVNWDNSERDKYTRYLKVCKKEVRSEKLQQCLSEVRQSRNDKLIAYVKECYKSTKTKLSDMQILVENKLFEVHRFIIACFIPFIFYRLSKISEKELQNKESLKIRLKGVKSEAMEQILNYIYTGDLDPTENNFFLVLETANRCYMNEFSDVWIVAFESKMQSKALQLLFRCRVARNYGWKEYVAILNKTLALNFEALMLTEQFFNLKADELSEILQENEIGVKNEVIVFLAVLKWLNHDWTNRETNTVQLMNKVRFHEMNNEQLVACLNPPILKQALQINEVKAMVTEALNYVQNKRDKQTEVHGKEKRIYRYENGIDLILWTNEHSKQMTSKDYKSKETVAEETILMPETRPENRNRHEYDQFNKSATKQSESFAAIASHRSPTCKCSLNHKNIEECEKAAAVDFANEKRKTRETTKLETTPKMSIKTRSKSGSIKSEVSSPKSKVKLRYDCYNS